MSFDKEIEKIVELNKRAVGYNDEAMELTEFALPDFLVKMRRELEGSFVVLRRQEEEMVNVKKLNKELGEIIGDISKQNEELKQKNKQLQSIVSAFQELPIQPGKICIECLFPFSVCTCPGYTE